MSTKTAKDTRLNAFNDRLAFTKQGLMERMGVRENEIDTPSVVDNYRKLDSVNEHLTLIQKRLQKVIQTTSNMEDSHLLADAIRGAQLTEEDAMCKTMFQKLSEFQTIADNLRDGLNNLLLSEVKQPLEKFTKVEIKEGILAKRKYDKVRLCYETALNQLKNQTKNKKVINLNKVTEADLKKDTFEEAFQQVSIETTNVLTTVLEQHEFLTLDALCFYLEAYYTYFANGFEYLKELKPLIAQTKQVVQERKKVFESKKQKSNSFNGGNKIKRTIFDVDLNVLEEKIGKKCPTAIEEAFTFIEQRGTNVEGIFRISATKTVVEDVIQSIELNKPVAWDTLSEHVPAAIVKEFLRNLPDPLLTFQLFDSWIQLEDEEDEFEEKYKKLYHLLPECNKYIFDKLIHLCCKIIKDSEKNKMGAKQLAIVIAPNILRAEVESSDPSSIVAALASVNQVIYKIINFHFNGGSVQLTTKPDEKNEQGSTGKLNNETQKESKKEPQRVALEKLKPPTNFPETEPKIEKLQTPNSRASVLQPDLSSDQNFANLTPDQLRRATISISPLRSRVSTPRDDSKDADSGWKRCKPKREDSTKTMLRPVSIIHRSDNSIQTPPGRDTNINNLLHLNSPTHYDIVEYEEELQHDFNFTESELIGKKKDPPQ